MTVRRLRLWADDVCLVVSTTIRGLGDDPLQFLVQIARRLGRARPPRRVGSGVIAAYGWFLADRPEVSSRILERMPARSGFRGRLAARLAVQLGVRRATSSDPIRVQACDRMNVGDLAGALAVAPPGSGMARRLASELDVLAPGPRPADARRGSDHVLFVLTNSLPYTRSGYTARTHSMLRALADAGTPLDATTRIGYPTTIGHVGTPECRVVDGIRYHRLPTARLPMRVDDRLMAQADALQSLCGDIRPGLLHCTTDYTNAIVTRELARRTRLPWVYEMRGQLELTWVAARPESIRASAATSEKVRLLRAKETELAMDANAVIVLSAVQRDDLVARGVAADSITVIPNGVDPSLLGQDQSPAEARAALGVPAEGFWVGSVSSIVAYEGFDVLLHAVALCRDAGLDVRCAITGDGVTRPRLLSMATDLRIADAVRLPGRVAREDAHRWHQALDVFVVPRHDQTVTRMVTPLKPIEAMALARPVIASDLPALAELVVLPGSGALFPAGDATALAKQIMRMADDPIRRREFALAGRRFASERTWTNAARQCRDLYAGLA